MSGDKLTAMAEALRTKPAHVLRGAGYLDRAADMLDGATELVEALNEAFDFLGGCDGASEIRGKILAALTLHDRALGK